MDARTARSSATIGPQASAKGASLPSVEPTSFDRRSPPAISIVPPIDVRPAPSTPPGPQADTTPRPPPTMPAPMAPQSDRQPWVPHIVPATSEAPAEPPAPSNPPAPTPAVMTPTNASGGAVPMPAATPSLPPGYYEDTSSPHGVAPASVTFDEETPSEERSPITLPTAPRRSEIILAWARQHKLPLMLGALAIVTIGVGMRIVRRKPAIS